MAKTKITMQTVFALCDRIYIETGKTPARIDLTRELACSHCTVAPFLGLWLAQRERPSTTPEKLATGRGITG